MTVQLDRELAELLAHTVDAHLPENLDRELVLELCTESVAELRHELAVASELSELGAAVRRNNPDRAAD